MDPLILLVSANVLAVLLASASLHKLVHRAEFRRSLTAYELVPDQMVPVLALGLPMLELASAAMLLIDPWRVLGGVLGAAMFAVYALAMSINLLRGRRDLACGCGWGVSSAEAEPRVSFGLVARNLVLIALALMLASVQADRPANGIDLLNGAFSGVVLVLLWATVDRLLANGKRMSLRRAS